MRILSFILTICFFNVGLLQAGQTEFEKLLEKNKTYRAVIENISSGQTDPDLKEGLSKTKSALDAYLEEKKNPKQPAHAELVAQSEMDMKGCETCQNYLNLSGEVNQILKKMNFEEESRDVNTTNTLQLELNKLSFLYYVVKHDNGNGGIYCAKYGNIQNTQANLFPGTFKLLAEEAFDLPNVNEVQYIPEGGKEVVYLYRGAGSDRNKVYEVHIRPDGKALIKYFSYTPSSAEKLFTEKNTAIDKILSKLPALEDKERKKGDDYLDIGVEIKTRDTIIPTDLEVVNAGKKVNLADDLIISTKTKLSFNEQETDVALANSKGEAFFKVNAKNKTEGKTEFITVIPMSLSLDEETKLALGASVKAEVGIDRETKTIDQNRTINLNLTDHNHKYLDIELYQRPGDRYTKVSASNNYNLGAVGNVGMNYTQDSSGARTYSLSKNTNLGDYGTLKTEFGGGNQTKHFVALQHEVALSKTSTLSIGARADDGKQYSTTFQFRTRF